MSTTAQKFEAMVILQPDLGKEKTEKELDSIRKHISSHKGEIYHEDLWGIRDLAYLIKQNESGYYAIFYFNGDKNKISELKKNLYLEANILRHMIVKPPNNYEIKPLSEFELPTREEREAEKEAEKEAKKKAQQTVKKEEKKEEIIEKPKEEEEKVEEKVEEKATEKVTEPIEEPTEEKAEKEEAATEEEKVVEKATEEVTKPVEEPAKEEKKETAAEKEPVKTEKDKDKEEKLKEIDKKLEDIINSDLDISL